MEDWNFVKYSVIHYMLFQFWSLVFSISQVLILKQNIRQFPLWNSRLLGLKVVLTDISGTKSVLNNVFFYHLRSSLLVRSSLRSSLLVNPPFIPKQCSPGARHFLCREEKSYIMACILKPNLKIRNYKHEVFWSYSNLVCSAKNLFNIFKSSK